MAASRALVSCTATVDPSFRDDHLKLCFLWYDEVLFETLNDHHEKHFLEQLVGDHRDAKKVIRDLSDSMLSLNSRVDSEVIKYPKSRPEGYPRWGHHGEYYTYPEPENAEQFAHNRHLQYIEDQYGLPRHGGEAREQVEGTARVSIDAVQLWERVNSEVPCVLQATDHEKVAMTAAREFVAATPEQPPTPFRLFEIVLPSLSTVPWPEVVKLRRDGRIASLRGKVSEALQEAGRNLDGAARLFNEVKLRATEDAIENGRPRVKRIAIESILGNIPGGPINPFGVFFAARDAVQALKRNRELGWFYMLREIKAASER